MDTMIEEDIVQSIKDSLVTRNPETETNVPLRDAVNQALRHYFEHLNGQDPAELYDLVLKEVEKPLLIKIMEYTRNNQSRAAILLGISRGTLRKKLKEYGML